MRFKADSLWLVSSLHSDCGIGFRWVFSNFPWLVSGQPSFSSTDHYLSAPIMVRDCTILALQVAGWLAWSFVNGSLSCSSAAAAATPSSACLLLFSLLLLLTNKITTTDMVTTKAIPHPNTHIGWPAIFLPWHSAGTLALGYSWRWHRRCMHSHPSDILLKTQQGWPSAVLRLQSTLLSLIWGVHKPLAILHLLPSRAQAPQSTMLLQLLQHSWPCLPKAQPSINKKQNAVCILASWKAASSPPEAASKGSPSLIVITRKSSAKYNRQRIISSDRRSS